MADPTVISATRYPGGVLRAIVKDATGIESEVEWHYLPDTKLPPMQLPAGVLMQAFVAGGGVVADSAVTAIPVPNWKAPPGLVAAPVATLLAVTRLQGRLALSRAGLLAKAETAVSAAGGETAIWYDDAQVWRRDDPHVAAIGQALGLASADVDELFTAAASI